MSAFERIDSARKYGTEYEKTALKISIIQLRLSRWAESVQSVTSATTIGSAENGATAERLLAEIESELEQAEDRAKRYKLKEETTSPDDRKKIALIENLISKTKRLAEEFPNVGARQLQLAQSDATELVHPSANRGAQG